MVVSIRTIHSPDQATEDASHNEHVQVADLGATWKEESDLSPRYLKKMVLPNATIEHGCVNLHKILPHFLKHTNEDG